MYNISDIFGKIEACIDLYSDILLWIKEWCISLFDHRLRYFVYGLSDKGFQHIQYYYYKNFLPFGKK